MDLKALTVRNFLQLLTVFGLLCSCGSESKDNSAGSGGLSASAPNVLLVVVDTLRADHLGFYGYSTAPTSPFLDSLQAESIIVEGLQAVTSWTMPSMATLFTGLIPADHKVMRMVGPGSSLMVTNTLASQFRRSNYATACIMSNFLLGGGGRGFNEGFDWYDFSLCSPSHPHRGSTAKQVAAHGLEWLAKQPADKPWFLNLHFFDPHTSYEDQPAWNFADPSYHGWVVGGLEDEDYKSNQASSSVTDLRQLNAFYDEEIREVDEALRTLIAALKKSGQWQNTMLVFTTDHGEELAERGYIGHTRTLHFEQVDLPLMVRLPKAQQIAARRKGLLGQHRLFNTILELAGLPVVPGAGPSAADWLLGKHADSEQEANFFEVDFVPIIADPTRRIQKRGMQLGQDFKFVYDRKIEEEFLFDLQKDPLERNNVAADPQYAAQVAEMRKRMAAHSWY
ncbi:MAG: sulfatase [Planctomycetes bacterium]|nr:sulfatase [Planctomycetota bacterium]